MPLRTVYSKVVRALIVRKAFKFYPPHASSLRVC